MTSAVINNLDTLNTSFNSITEVTSTVDTLSEDFSKILDVKNFQLSDVQNMKISDTNSIEQITALAENLIPSTLGNLKSSIIENADKITTILNEVLSEIESELSIDFTIVQENNVISEDIANTEITENTTIENNENSQNTITNEDSTMQKEQILTPPPENLLTLNVFHLNQQIQKSVDLENNVESLKEYVTESNVSIKNENTSFKQFNMFDEKQGEQIYTEDIPEDDETVVKPTTSKLSDIMDDSILDDLNVESVECEVGDNQQQSSDLMQNQSPQEQGIKAVIQAEVKYDDIKIELASQIKNNSTEINAGKIIDQITKHMENMHNGSKVNIVLNPESLGKISVQILNSKEGLMAQFTVTSQDVKDILMKGLVGLRESLLAQGVSVDNVTVKLADSGDSEYQGDWTDREGSQGGFKEHNAKHKKEDKKQFEQMMFEIENNDNV